MQNDTQTLLNFAKNGVNPFPALSLQESCEFLELTGIHRRKRTDEQQMRYENLYRRAFQNRL